MVLMSRLLSGFSDIASNEIDVEKIQEDELCLIVGKRHPMYRKDKVRVTELKKENLALLTHAFITRAPIDRYCEERGLALKDRLRLLVQVCSGLTHAHQRLVVHCDVKPANILVTGDGTVKLLDFGIAKFVDPEKTMTQCRPGTPACTACSRCTGSRR